MGAKLNPTILKGMVSEERLKEAELNAQKKPAVAEEGTMVEKELALLIEIGYSMNKKLEKLDRLVEIFEGVAKEEPKVEQPDVAKEVKPIAPTSTPIAPPIVEQSSKVKEILEKLEPIKDLITVDMDTSAQFVMIRFPNFLGAENFKKVGEIMRTLGGQYVSKGKDSHFLIQKQENPQ